MLTSLLTGPWPWFWFALGAMWIGSVIQFRVANRLRENPTDYNLTPAIIGLRACTIAVVFCSIVFMCKLFFRYGV